MRGGARYVPVALIAIVAALLGVYAARLLTPSVSDAQAGGLHELLHGEIVLSAAQNHKIEQLEAQFSADRRGLDARLHDANGAIAAAYRSEHAYGPKVADAIDRSHVVMGELQKLTLRHVLAMRAVLTPAQAVAFDREVDKALTSGPAR